MTVYLVWYRVMYEGDSLEAIFATEDLARAWIVARSNSHRYHIEDREVHSTGADPA